MGFLGKLRGKASDAVDKHGEKIKSGADKAKDALDKLDGKDDDIK